jgi:hypothetical protein
MNKKTALLALALITMFVAGVIAGYVWYSFTIPVEVKEPLEVVGYPEIISLYAGENETFAINITNYAKANYLVTLAFTLDNATYQEAYVTFSDISYTVVSGDNTLEAWISVSHEAPLANLTLTVDFERAAPIT